MEKPFARFFALIFCTVFEHGFFARTCGADFCVDFCTIFCKDFCSHLSQPGNHLLGSAKISPTKSPQNFKACFGPSGKGLGRHEGKVETLSLANLTKARVSKNLGGGYGVPMEEVAIPVDLNRICSLLAWLGFCCCGCCWLGCAVVVVVAAFVGMGWVLVVG